MGKNVQEIEQTLVSCFIKNLEFFKKSQPELFEKIELLSTALNEGLYKEQYALEYVQEIGDFDILELESNTYLYNKKFTSFNDEELQTLNLKKIKTFSNVNRKYYKFKTFSCELPNTKYKLLDEYIEQDISKMSSLFSDLTYSDTYKYTDKMLFLGTLLGGHIQMAIKKVKPKLCFIIEPNLELFRLSLFITDYEKIAQNTHLLFSIMDESTLFMQKLDLFIAQHFQFSNYNIKYSKMPYFSNDIVQTILTKLHLENPFIFDYTKVLYDTVYFIAKHINTHNILTLKSNKEELSSFFKDKPILFIGAGPSFSKNIEWIKEYQNQFIIVAMGAVYKKLFEHNIKADVVTTVDAQYEVLDRAHFNAEDVKILKDTVVIASIGTPTKILNRFNQEKLFLFETYQALKTNSNAYNGASVGEVSLNILLDLNVSCVYMLGIDLAIDEKSGATHYEGYINQKQTSFNIEELNSVLKEGEKSLKDEFLTVKGIDKKEVATTRVFALSIVKYEQIIAEIKSQTQKLYNLSKEAAHIEGVEYLDKKEIKLKEVAKANLFVTLKEHSEFGLEEKEEIDLSKRIVAIEELLDFIQKSSLKNSVKNLPQFLEYINELFRNIIKTNDYICSNLLANYFKVMLPYIYESLNDEKIKPKIISKKSEEAKELIFRQMEKIVEMYLEYMNRIIKEK